MPKNARRAPKYFTFSQQHIERSKRSETLKQMIESYQLGLIENATAHKIQIEEKIRKLVFEHPHLLNYYEKTVEQIPGKIILENYSKDDAINESAFKKQKQLFAQIKKEYELAVLRSLLNSYRAVLSFPFKVDQKKELESKIRDNLENNLDHIVFFEESIKFTLSEEKSMLSRFSVTRQFESLTVFRKMQEFLEEIKKELCNKTPKMSRS